MTSRSAQSSSNLIDRLWRLAVADRTLLLLLLLLTLTGALALLLPQVPADIIDEEATSRWLAETGTRFGSLGGLLAGAGLFALWQSPWLSLLLGLLAFVILLRLAGASAEAVQRLRQADFEGLGAMAGAWPLRSDFVVRGDTAAVAAEIAEDLGNEGWQVASRGGPAGAQLVAERSRWALLAAPLASLGLLLLLLALWLNRYGGWQEAGLNLLPDQPTALSHLPRLWLTLEPGTQEPAAVVLAGPDGVVDRQAFSSAGRAQVRSLNVRQTGQGLALAVSAADAVGQPVLLQPLEQGAARESTVNLVFDQPRAERAFLVPERQLAFSIVAVADLPEGGPAGPRFLVQAFQVGRQEPVFNDYVASDSSFAIGDDNYSLQSRRFFTVRVSRSPGFPLAVVAILLLAGAAFLALWRPAGGLHVDVQRLPRDQAVASASLLPSLTWRQGRRWLAAWSDVYRDGDHQER